MEILLDTTIIIEKLFKRKRRLLIDDLLKTNSCGISLFVLGEFKANIVKDFVTLCNIFIIEKDLSGVRKNINENIFGRSFHRMYYIYDDLCDKYENDFELIKMELETYVDRLQLRMDKGLVTEIIDGIGCHRAEAKVVYNNNSVDLEGIKCTKKNNFCNKCDFWSSNKEKIQGLQDVVGLPANMREPLSMLLENDVIPAGNACKSLGDCVITLEALDTTSRMVCTTNIKDFQPICDHVGVRIRELKEKS